MAAGDAPHAGGAPAWARRAADGLLALVAVSIPLSTTGMEGAVLGLGALAAAGVVAGWGVVRRTPLDAVLGLFYATLALSTLASGHPLEAGGWGRLWVVLAYFAVFWWLRDAEHGARLTRLLVGAGTLAAAYGILQHFTGADWYRSLLGRQSFVRPRQAGDTGYAVVGFFRNYLTFAHTMLFPLSWSAAAALRGAPLGIVGAPLLVTAIVFSTARGVWLATLAVAAVVLAICRGLRCGWVLAACALAAGLAFAATPDLGRRAAAMFGMEGENAGRVGIYQANLDIVRAHPILGLGFGRYQTAAAPFYDRYPAADRRSHAHDDYLQVAAESGLAGLAAFMLVYATALRRGWRAVAGAADAARWAAAAGAWVGIVGFLVGGVTQYNFGDNEVAVAMWVALAVLMRVAEE